jgi:hypothetical protein
MILISGSDALAQGGGKAEPLRIELKRGTTNTTIADKVKDDQQVEYVLTAKKRQRLTIKLTSVPRRTAVVDQKRTSHHETILTLFLSVPVVLSTQRRQRRRIRF